jgi:outer membrane immunogenic protein
MKRILLATVALIGWSGATFAADMPVKAPVAPMVCPTCNWSGFYIGVNAGGSIGVDSNVDRLSGFPTGGGFPNNPYLSSDDKRALPGGLGGAQIGFNWQAGNWVFGGEADWQYSNERSTLTVTGQDLAATLFTSSYSDEERIKSLGTARARLGWASDGWLWYVTGGAAWARVESNYVLTSSLPAVTFASPVSVGFATNKGGWTVGGGVETCLGTFGSSNWSAKLEYLYVDLGSITNAFQTPTTTAGTFATFSSSNSIRDHIIRVGLNYRFSGGLLGR